MSILKKYCFKSLLLLIGFLFVSNIGAQTIQISAPEDGGKEYFFILNQGLQTDTIQQGTVNFVGGVTVKIPESYKSYQGMGILKINGRKPTQMVVNNEDFKVEIIEGSPLKFTNSPENDFFYNVLKGTELPADTALYASRFMGVLDYIRSLNAIVNKNSGGLYERSSTLLYGLDKLDIDDLFTSGMWFYGIDGLIKLSGDQENIGNNMVTILKRVKSDKVFEALVNNLITITEQFGLDDAFDIIIPYVEQSGRIEVPTGNLYTAFALAKIQKGTVIPKIVGLKKALSSERSLIVFYQSDCSNCEVQIQELIKEYPEIKAKGIRVISISASYDKAENDTDNKRFPWKDNICDFKGFAGANFINYGITSTPTFFLVDKEHKLIKRFAVISDLSQYLN